MKMTHSKPYLCEGLWHASAAYTETTGQCRISVVIAVVSTPYFLSYDIQDNKIDRWFHDLFLQWTQQPDLLFKRVLHEEEYLTRY